MDYPSVLFYPIISSIQRIALYETKSKYYLLGSNNTQTRFRVLKIDRTEPKDLIVIDDKIEYTKDEIHSLVNMIDMGNRTRADQWSGNGGLTKVISAFGIVGFIQFLEGHYIILVTKRRKVAVIGHHTIYKVEDTCMIYIPNESVRIVHPDEPRYVKMFQNIDLSSNFYYSYSYDLTHTLQMNMAPPRHISPNHVSDQHAEYRNHENEDYSTIEDAKDFLDNWLFPKTKQPHKSFEESVQNYGIRSKPHRKFVWNSYLLSAVESQFHPDWIIYITHGFVGQSNMSIFGRSVYVTLIARRSNKYAGTRFLKRGANFEGDVANEVETEQMVHDSGVSSLNHGHFSSFVQMRGSIPGHWSQDITRIVPKPPISIDLSDPYGEVAGAHLNELLKRYGSPIIILNLVKKREKKKHESFLSEEMSAAVKYLNQFLPPDHQIQYITFDMARMNKGKEANVLGKLADIAYNAVLKTGVFTNHRPYFNQKPSTVVGLADRYRGRLQTGIIRTNCVDCLDRTNTAQFAIGKYALGFQLCALGFLESPKLEFDTDCVRMLESLYEDHGDTLALQYGGSQLVHRIKTYRKTAPWTSQGNDIMQTLSRYYSNTFSDAEKQNTINLFLGLFIPNEHNPQIWEQITDYYLHHSQAVKYVYNLRVPKTQWWDAEILHCLPRAYNEITKSCSEIVRVHNKGVEMIDAYIDYHRPCELTMLSETYSYKISNSIRDFMPNFTINFSPFTVRIRPGRRREETSSKGGIMKNPSLTGQSSTSSTASSTSSSMDSDSSEDETNGNPNESQISGSKDSYSATITFESLFPSMRQVYGTEPENPDRPNILLYKRYVLIGRKANATGTRNSSLPAKMIKFQPSNFSQDTSVRVIPPKVSTDSGSIYKQYVLKGIFGGTDPKPTDMKLYEKYTRENLCKKCDVSV